MMRHITLRIRLVLLLIAASLPCELLIGFLFYREYQLTQDWTLLLSRLGELAVIKLFSIGVVITGASVLVSEPLRQVASAVRRWRSGGAFESGNLDRAPVELRDLGAAFGQATDLLGEEQRKLRAAVTQQDLLMQEIHHRVKNNLQIIASLLNLQASRIRQPESRAEFQSARDRIRALATLHRHLYAHGELHTINMRAFLSELCEQLIQAIGEGGPREEHRIALDIEAPELQISSDQAVPIALIVTEAVSNATKYAFPSGRRGHIRVRLTLVDEAARLEIADDGVGIPAGRAETETGVRDGLGRQLIRGFARQLGATLSIIEEGGTCYVVVIPLHRARAVAAG